MSQGNKGDGAQILFKGIFPSYPPLAILPKHIYPKSAALSSLIIPQRFAKGVKLAFIASLSKSKLPPNHNDILEALGVGHWVVHSQSKVAPLHCTFADLKEDSIRHSHSHYSSMKAPSWAVDKGFSVAKARGQLGVELIDGGGQPTRGMKILSILFRNLQNSQKSLSAFPGGLATIIGYNKLIQTQLMNSQTKQCKLITLACRTVEEEFAGFLWGEDAHKCLHSHLFYGPKGSMATTPLLSVALEDTGIKMGLFL
ncbi:uncharacterized protein EI90DRAFT_3019930 [Cantharellus anzutake]|uniref:uncharacterized protein n=1 Tax=Cantharellus anzutake TaxID=1750568 RepID=UPI001903AD7F|nr:uncharacterized protein EI90DRAFT_3019930 [Cantharellus anzutake]KAF8322937.1 hypothetical protein EI90DRAFT_3019930 [Cantharellus anzutake]